VARGIVRSELLVLETERMTAAGRGTLSLENEALALTITPTAKEPAQAEAAVPMDVGGTLGHPTVFPIRAAGQQAQLAEASSRAAAGNAAGNACVDAMAQIKKGAVAPARRQGQQEQP
ncbi:MAG: hypothetical protein K2Q10_10655, partial [Rhodospirillales bacterium]|nr:hypothetical protein [Rhodospirillales bacterium]